MQSNSKMSFLQYITKKASGTTENKAIKELYKAKTVQRLQLTESEAKEERSRVDEDRLS